MVKRPMQQGRTAANMQRDSSLLAIRFSPSDKSVPIVLTCVGTSRTFILSKTAARRPARHLLVQYVLEMNVSWAACIEPDRPIIAAIGWPLPNALAKTAISGSYPRVRWAPPKLNRQPEVISSITKRIRSRLQISRIFWTNSGVGLAERIGSNTTAANFPLRRSTITSS